MAVPTCTTSRRRFLAAAPAAALAGPLAAVPALATIAASDPILGLRRAWQAAQQAQENLFARLSAAHDRFDATRPSVPEVLFEKGGDHFGPTIKADGSGNLPPSETRFYYTAFDIGRMRERLAVDQPPVLWLGARRARAEEIVAAWDAYEAATDAAMKAAGYEEGTEEEDAVTRRLEEITRQVAHTPALTLAGLIFKGEVAAFVSDPGGDTLLGRAEEAFADGYECSATGVGLAIIRDLCRLAAATAP